MYKEVVSPMLEKFDSEKTHHIVKKAFHLTEKNQILINYLLSKRVRDSRLAVNFGGVSLDNPAAVGAGWDKSCEAVLALYAAGFASIVGGTVTLRSQPGNPHDLEPRQVMLERGVSWNWLGFPSPGAWAVRRNLKKYQGLGIPIGISIGINKDTKPQDAACALGETASILYDQASYFEINYSSPNTPGLRNLLGKEFLTDSVQAVNDAMDSSGGRKPLFIKYSPDMTTQEILDGLYVGKDNGVTGFVAANTTINPEIKGKYGLKWVEKGGLGGDDIDYRALTTRLVSFIHKESGGEFVIAGVGGVKDTPTALEKIRAGASFVQLVTALRGEGPFAALKINKGILDYMDKTGVKSIKELIGVGF
jgi:dihydroorotate dehydrogenase